MDAAASDLGLLRLEVAAAARVTADQDLRDHVLTLSFWRQPTPLAPQLRGATAPGLLSFLGVPGGAEAERLDLRLADTVLAATVLRVGPTAVEIQLSSRAFPGAAVRLAVGPSSTLGVAGASDLPLRAALSAPTARAPEYAEAPPFLFPLGVAGALNERERSRLEPRSWGGLPGVVRAAFRSDPVVRAAVDLAESGRSAEAARSLFGFETPDDPARILLALARGWIWSQPGPDGRAAEPAMAAEAFQLAAALAPAAPWEGWARARSGYHQELDLRFDEALFQYARAATVAPDDPERAHWEVLRGMALMGRGRVSEGVEHVADWLGGVDAREEAFRFEARRAVLEALWAHGEPERAATVFDLLGREHAARTQETRWAPRWGLLLLDAGRYAEALPHLERIETTAERRVLREQARWWQHEASLGLADLVEARRALRRILEQTPGSALVPLATLRLEVLDLLSISESDRALTWPEFALKLQERAQAWPHTPLEDEALSATAQIYLSAGLLGDGLHLLAWVEDRSPSRGGATAFEALVCRYAPAAFRDLRARGEAAAALGVWRRFLERPSVQACVDPATRAEAAATALTAGLPELALTFLGQAVSEGRGGADDAHNLVTMASIYLSEGRVGAARRTLEFIEGSDLPLDGALMASVWGDVLVEDGDPAGAAMRYALAIEASEGSLRARLAVPGLHYRRGLALLAAGEPAEGERALLAALAAGGAEHPALAWVTIAGLRQATAEAGSDASLRPGDAKTRAAWTATLEAADAALAAPPDGDSTRAATWHRANALIGLRRGDEGRLLLGELSRIADAWGLLAANRQSALALEGQLDQRTRKPRR